MLDDDTLESHGLYLCRYCEDYIGNSEGLLWSHVNKHHDHKRCHSNHAILTDKLYGPVQQHAKNHWEDGLAFLRSLNISEPPFRQSLITKIQGRTSQYVTDLAMDIVKCVVEGSQSPTSVKDVGRLDFDVTPMWLLIILLEQLVLFPPPDFNKDATTLSLNQEICRRVRLFRSGDIRTLYQESRRVHSRSVAEFASRPKDTNKSAQLAADLDNFKLAIARLTKNTPVAPITDGPEGNLHHLEQLHPPSLQLPDTRPRMRTRAGHSTKKRCTSPHP